jgi:hypothetical protein
MGLQEDIATWLDPENYVLTDEEFEAAREYIHNRMDSLDWETKQGLLKLLNGENYRRMSKKTGEGN